MNKNSYSNLAKAWDFVENTVLEGQSQDMTRLRMEAQEAGLHQGSAAQADFLKMLVALTCSTSIIAIGTGSLVETLALIDGLDRVYAGGQTGSYTPGPASDPKEAPGPHSDHSGGQLTAVDSSAQGIEAIRRLFTNLSDHSRTTLRAVNAPASVFLPRLNAGVYQMIVVAGEAGNYQAAFDQASRLLSDHGLIVLTDMLAMEGPDAQGGLVNPADRSDKAVAMRTLLDDLVSDEGFDTSLIPVGTGLLLAQKR
ncbi:methyltransferase [Bifidobacterium aemilianum]|uniref:Methyltransferase n=1 Tax=Bifidobacterium aemilianum TaxID=2493120 RepID=A0A366K8Z4_9BIFI|nr:methyltransferase [Bifidobacterium aemilianum]RBP98139.1 methyltransferase [Bifidobacterium aemilianum]